MIAEKRPENGRFFQRTRSIATPASLMISLMTWLAAISPPTEGTNAFELGGIFALRMTAASLPTTCRTSWIVLTGG